MSGHRLVRDPAVDAVLGHAEVPGDHVCRHPRLGHAEQANPAITWSLQVSPNLSDPPSGLAGAVYRDGLQQTKRDHVARMTPRTADHAPANLGRGLGPSTMLRKPFTVGDPVVGALMVELGRPGVHALSIHQPTSSLALDLSEAGDGWLGRGRLSHAVWNRSRSWALQRCICRGNSRCRIEGRANHGDVHVVDLALLCRSGTAAVLSTVVEAFDLSEGVEPPTALLSLGNHTIDRIVVVLGKAQRRFEPKGSREHGVATSPTQDLWRRADWFRQRAYEE